MAATRENGPSPPPAIPAGSAAPGEATPAPVAASPAAASPEPPAAPLVPSEPQAGTTTDQLEKLRIEIATTIKQYFPWLFILTLVVAVSLIAMIGFGFIVDRTMATTVLAASVQVAFGMVIGFVCVYIGLMMTWFGIDAAFTVKGRFGGGGAAAEGALKSASPGLLFALGGLALIAVSLYKPIVYETQGLGLSSVRTSGGSADPLPDPQPPRLPERTNAAAPTPQGPDDGPQAAPFVPRLPDRGNDRPASPAPGVSP